MLGTSRQKTRNIQGFTLMETLTVVVIVGVFASFAASSLFQQWKRLQLTDLDGTAREIYMSAQSDLMGRKVSGTLGTLTADAGGSAQPETASGDGVTETLYYIDSATAGGSLPKTGDLLFTLLGSYVLYLNPRTGDVTDVYYSKDTLTYDAVDALRKLMDGTDDPDIRSKEGIGYYGGGTLSETVGGSVEEEIEEPHGTEMLKLINQEDLYVELRYPNLGSAATNPEKVKAIITLTDESGDTAAVTADGQPPDTDGTSASHFWGSIDSDNTYTLYVLLDSMVEGGSFTELFPDLAAGDDITVKATLSYAGKPLYQNALIGTANSLFAQKYDEDVTVGGMKHRRGVEFAYARQLSNLRYYHQGRAAAVQTGDIDFIKTLRQENMLPAKAHRDTAPDTFTPILLTDSAKQGGITIDGQDGAGTVHTLSNFKIFQTGNVGLVGKSTVSATIQNLRLKDWTVSGGVGVGALIGSLSSSEGSVVVENCGVYLTGAGKGFVTGGNGVYGDEAPTGGLIGEVQAGGKAVLIQNCFSSLAVGSSKQTTGGLIGRVGGGTSGAPVKIQNSYASGSVAAGTLGTYRAAAGGLIGASSGVVKMNDSFSAAAVFGASSCGGLVGAASGSLGIDGSYACGTVVTGTAETYGPLVGSGSAVYTDCKYLSQSGNAVVADAGATPDGVSAYEYDDLAKGVKNAAAKCHPYRQDLLKQAYPFPMVTAEYYGDWPVRYEPTQKIETPYGLCYYEQYSDGTWGFYGYDKAGDLADSLDYANAKTISLTGYGVLVPEGTEDVKAPRFDKNNIYWGVAVFDGKTALSTLEQDLYPLRNGGSDLLNYNNQTARVVYDAQADRNVYLNSLFAAAISMEPLKVNETDPMQIRTEEQLRNKNSVNEGWYYKQTHNITVSKSDTGYLNLNYTTGGFDGGNNLIIGLKVPLIATNSCPVKNVRLVGVDIYQSGSAGALAVVSQAPVENCHLLSGSIVSTGGNAAGLIGGLNSNGTDISNCSVGGLDAAQKVTVRAGGQYAAGLVATATSGSIRNSTVENTSVSATGSITAAAGLIAYSNSIIVDGCSVGKVVACSVTSQYGSAGGLMVKSQAEVTDCSFVGTVKGYGDAAGLIVSTESSGSITSMDGSTAKCDVVSENGSAGGLLVKNQAPITNCSFTGTITAAADAAGLAVTNLDGGSSRIKDCAVDAKILSLGGNAAGLAITNGNSASISGCSATGSVTAQKAGKTASGGVITNRGSISLSYSASAVTASGSGGNAAGFVDLMQSGTVASCYYSGTVTAVGGTAAGFCRSITNGTVSDCFAVGTASAGKGMAVGFVKTANVWNSRSVVNSYSAVEVLVDAGGTAAGFTADDVKAYINYAAKEDRYVNCYWVSQPGFNEAVSQETNDGGKVVSVTFAQLETLKTVFSGWNWDSGSGSWTLNTSAGQTHPFSETLKGSAYPYPRILMLDFYGDWRH
ncbi:prepilin-type N-terminal cleavage/methylation domain-containing protein [Oscillibacter sp.]|uniref:pilus assembly FimT family protein n=1 Tax=Oscillibacter sp. TaxID=1945593 RepID=UPI00289B4848|nr:prepilin-type N-terminal cleavage/methylation domain-containing protein [Oscillibacter sp.]